MREKVDGVLGIPHELDWSGAEEGRASWIGPTSVLLYPSSLAGRHDEGQVTSHEGTRCWAVAQMEAAGYLGEVSRSFSSTDVGHSERGVCGCR